MGEIGHHILLCSVQLGSPLHAAFRHILPAAGDLTAPKTQS